MAKIHQSIDDEWESFDEMAITIIAEEHKQKVKQDRMFDIEEVELEEDVDEQCMMKMGGGGGNSDNIPTPTALYISTKSKIVYLNNTENLELNRMFWGIPIIPYATPTNGVIKKQTKFNSTTEEELNYINDKVKEYLYSSVYVISSINNATGRIKFKDVRKVSIGISKKDLTNHHSKQKSAFYNCFVLIVRLKIEEVFKEFHVKIFNTGKIEIPGIPTDSVFEKVKDFIIQTLQPFVDFQLLFKDVYITVLVNSNFNCGFYINREVLFDILSLKYNLQCMYDPCSYPGIQCKFYYNASRKTQTGSKKTDETGSTGVSFMIFRTGSVLIVGMCEEHILYIIYEFIKKILIDEYTNIFQSSPIDSLQSSKLKIKKPRKKIIMVQDEKA